MTYSRATLVVLLLCVCGACTIAQQKVKIEGVWQAISQKMDGKDVLMSGKDRKLITAKHFVFIYQDVAKCLSLLANKTQRDSIAAYYDQFGAGAGTYTLVGNTYTETIEFFGDPTYVGLSLPFTVKVEGDKLYQSGKFPVMEGGKKVKEVLIEEVYKRIE